MFPHLRAVEHKHIRPFKEFGLAVKKLRGKNNLTQLALSDECEIDIRTIQRIEAGEQNLTLAIILEIAKALNVTPSQLLKNIQINPVQD